MNTIAGKDAHWTNALHNPKSISALYSLLPEVIEVFRVAFNRDGPSIDIVGRLDHFPEEPPRKWVAAGSNRVLATIRLDGIRDATCGNWSTSNIGRLVLVTTQPGAIDFSFSTSKGVVLAGTASVARLQEFAHYLEPTI